MDARVWEYKGLLCLVNAEGHPTVSENTAIFLCVYVNRRLAVVGACAQRPHKVPLSSVCVLCAL